MNCSEFKFNTFEIENDKIWKQFVKMRFVFLQSMHSLPISYVTKITSGVLYTTNVEWSSGFHVFGRVFVSPRIHDMTKTMMKFVHVDFHIHTQMKTKNALQPTIMLLHYYL
jgi:hypothetical protein